jgi:hypothetical protein
MDANNREKEGCEMASTTTFGNPYDERMKVVMEFTNERDSSLHVKINLQEYFYPYISIRSDDIYDEQEGIGYEHFQREKTIINMLNENTYKEILKQRLAYGLDNYLRAVQAEAKFEFKEGESLEEKVAKNEETIFELLKKKGPGVFRYSAVIGKIQDWCDEKDYKKVETLIRALKEYAKSFCGSVPFSSFEQRYYLALNYERLLKNIRALKKDVNAKRRKARDDKKLKNEIIKKWKPESPTLILQNKHWFELLLGIARREEGKTGIGFIPFIKKRPPRELAIDIFREVTHLGSHSVDKIIRDKENITKTMMMEYDLSERRFWWDLDLC